MSDTETTALPETGSRPSNGGEQSTSINSSGSAPSPFIDQAKQQAQKVVDQTHQTAGEVLDQAKNRTRSWAEDQKAAVAQNLSNVAMAVMETGENLRGRSPDEYGKYAAVTDQAAEMVDKAAGYLRDTSVDQMIGEVESYGRREPGLFLIGAAVVGFLAARFLKSSGQRAAQGTPGYNPDRSLPVPINQQRGDNYDAASPAG